MWLVIFILTGDILINVIMVGKDSVNLIIFSPVGGVPAYEYSHLTMSRGKKIYMSIAIVLLTS